MNKYKNIEAQNSDNILRIISVRIIKAGIKIYVKNILRILQAHFCEKVKNTEARKKIHHSYIRKSVYRFHKFKLELS